MEPKTLPEQLLEIARQMYAREYISGLAGNLSARLPDGNLLVTPAGLPKNSLLVEDLLVVDIRGVKLAGAEHLHPTSELPMHLEVYQQRPEVGAVIHAHPVYCVALSMVGISLEAPFIPEALVMLGPIPTAQYATPSSEENRQAIAGLISNHDAIILAQHGSITVGQDLLQAYMRLETLEHTARTLALAYQLGEPSQLNMEAVEKLWALRNAPSS